MVLELDFITQVFRVFGLPIISLDVEYKINLFINSIDDLMSIFDKMYFKQVELTMHDGTVRDVCFIEDTSNKTSLLVSGGAGDCKIYVTDCATGNTFQVRAHFCIHFVNIDYYYISIVKIALPIPRSE